MRRRDASINDYPIAETERRYRAHDQQVAAPPSEEEYP
jgi:nuclear transport factor 2 (NTF2) superfamily protein